MPFDFDTLKTFIEKENKVVGELSASKYTFVITKPRQLTEGTQTNMMGRWKKTGGKQTVEREPSVSCLDA